MAHVNVDLGMPAADQLWNIVKEDIYINNTYMKLFLKLFNFEKVNGLSPLMIEINSLEYLRTLVVDFFKPLPKYPRDHPTEKATVINLKW